MKRPQQQRAKEALLEVTCQFDRLTVAPYLAPQLSPGNQLPQ